MTDRSTRCAVAVMAKVPQAGRSKTRLVPAVPPEAAAALSAAFLRDTTENIALAARDAPLDGHVAYAPAGLEGLFDGHLAAGTSLLLADGSGDMPEAVHGFGRCLLHATRTLLDDGYGAACVLNSDGPTLPTAFLVRAAALLAQPGDRAVLGPSEDGGYYLLGLKRAHTFMFADIDWSTGAVAAQTRDRALSAGLELVELPPWFDVDDRASLRHLLDALDRDDGGYEAPATRTAVDRLGIRALLTSA